MTRVEKLYDGAFLIATAVGGRPLYLPLLIGRDRGVLIDTGCASAFAEVVPPALASVGLRPQQLEWIITTHCDFDHQGGNAAAKMAFPSARLFCGEADREQIESPAALLDLRYDAYRKDHRIFYDEATRQAIRDELGPGQPVDGVFRGGEVLSLDTGRELEIVSLPGHSRGHLGILDRAHRTLFGGDAIHGNVYLDLQGRPALCPTYLHVAPYLETLRRVEAMNLDTYVGCHWPVKRGAEITAFCAESRAFVASAERMILAELERHPEGATLRQLCLRIGPELGSWPEAVNLELCYAFAGQLADLLGRHLIKENRTVNPVSYTL